MSDATLENIQRNLLPLEDRVKSVMVGRLWPLVEVLLTDAELV